MVREFFAWWFGQLAELLPQGLRRTALTAVDAMVIKPIGPRVTRPENSRRSAADPDVDLDVAEEPAAR